jgi:hypothetical protein
VYLILSASKDAYITDKIINGAFRATDANTGRAGTLDLFKLYDESSISGTNTPVELSRALIQFDLSQLRSLTGSVLDIADPSFRCQLSLRDVNGTQSVPRNFSLVAYPLSQSFDEGDGRDVGSFSDLDVCNFLTASYSGGTAYPWFASGANAIGLLGSPDIDIIGSGNLGSGVVQLGSSQLFDVGTEDLLVDVTQVVSGILVGLIPDHGFRVSFVPAEENDDRTRFVKRFGSRHSKNPFLRPSLRVTFDDTMEDNHANFIFDVTGSLLLSNYHRGVPSNILSGTALTPVVGTDSLALTLNYLDWSKTVLASQYTGSTTGAGLSGVYQAQLALASADPIPVTGTVTLQDVVLASGSVTFGEVWGSLDGTVPFYSGSLTVTAPQRVAYSPAPSSPILKVTNLQGSYLTSDDVRVQVFGLDSRAVQNRPAKSPRSLRSEVFDAVYYRVVDSDSGEVVVPITKRGNGTRLSVESNGMYFRFLMSSLPPGRVYHFEFLVVDRGSEYILPDRSPQFRVDAV